MGMFSKRLTCAAGLGAIFLGIAPKADDGDVIKSPPPAAAVLFAMSTFPGLKWAGLITPFDNPGGSCSISLPLKNGVPYKLVGSCIKKREHNHMVAFSIFCCLNDVVVKESLIYLLLSSSQKDSFFRLQSNNYMTKRF